VTAALAQRAAPDPLDAAVRTLGDGALWRLVNRRLIAKTISELSWEEALRPVETGAGGTFELPLDSGATYAFRGRRRIWGQIAVEPASMTRRAGGAEGPADDACGFFVDARAELGADAATLATYLKELSSTLLADMRVAAANSGMDAAALAALDPDRLQCRLEGHPKAPANKGRIGWGLEDHLAFAPESEPTFRLVWIAADRERCRLSLAPDLDEEALLEQSLDAAERLRLRAACRAAGVDPDRYVLMPVHPWQWTNAVLPHFAGEIASGRIVPLGSFGDAYLPQQSLRTLANADRPGRLQVKLPLTILNTSCWRGIPGRYMAAGPKLSRWLADIAATDPVLADAGTIVLGEVAGAFYPHPVYERLPDGPYQFHEMLGAIWRESVERHLRPGETGVMLGALHHCDDAGRPLASAWIERSGLGHAEWLERLFAAVVVPLYHFMCRWGIGFIAHGQNLTLVLKDAAPVRLAVKDLQGDCDVVDPPFPELGSLEPAALAVLPKRPAAHQIHDLQTGHFVTVLRFLSERLAAADGFPEEEFYAVLARVLRRYQAANPDLAPRFLLYDLFRPTMERVCINRARFRIGYGDAAQRPVPELGSDLANPLHRFDPVRGEPTETPRP
jgi:aerobactin synthase